MATARSEAMVAPRATIPASAVATGPVCADQEHALRRNGGRIFSVGSLLLDTSDTFLMRPQQCRLPASVNLKK